MVFVLLVGVLVIVAGVQAIQLNALTEKVSSAEFSSAAASSGTASTAKPSVLSQLPTQVGGC